MTKQLGLFVFVANHSFIENLKFRDAVGNVQAYFHFMEGSIILDEKKASAWTVLNTTNILLQTYKHPGLKLTRSTSRYSEAMGKQVTRPMVQLEMEKPNSAPIRFITILAM